MEGFSKNFKMKILEFVENSEQQTKKNNFGFSDFAFKIIICSMELFAMKQLNAI